MPISRKHKSIFLAGMALMAGATLFTGCASDPLPVSKSEQYTRDFIKTFGAFNQSHDWNHATQTTVTVTTATPTEVKVMADFEGKRYIFATYTNVEGTKTLNVDIPKGVSDLIVSANGHNYSVKAGGEVAIGAGRSRTMHTSDSDEVPVTVSDDYRIIMLDVLGSYVKKVPEGGENMGSEEIISNFSFKATDKHFTFYPIFWYSNSYHVLGLYWLDSEGKYHEQAIYSNKGGDELQYYDGTYEEPHTIPAYKDPDTPAYYDAPINCQTTVSWTDMGLQNGTNPSEDEINAAISKWKEEHVGKECPNHSDGLIHYYTDMVYVSNEWTFKPSCKAYHPAVEGEWHEEQYINNVDETKWTNPNPTSQTPFGCHATNETFTSSNTNAVRAKGISIDLEEGTPFGFFIDVYEDAEHSEGNYSHRCYSSANMNELAKAGVYTQINSKAQSIFYAGKSSKATTEGWINHKNADEHKFVTASYFSTTTVREDEDGITTTLNRTFFGFEDWGVTEVDLNDFICMVDESVAEQDDIVVDEDKPEPTPEEWQWIIACEDLGTNDFDFNDVVFSVSAVTTEGEGDDMKSFVKVKALASGGTLPVYIYFEKDGVRNCLIPEGTEASKGEFHKWFGNFNSNQVINAIKGGIRAEGTTITIEVPSTFSMSCGAKDNMGGFAVGVEYPGKDEIIKAISPYNYEDKDIEMIGTAPQMICVPYTWLWPTENTFILDVYEGFSGWCGEPDSNVHWHENPQGSYWQ